ncbi:MAG: helix-turn-helix domain-containing protein [Blastochloris sp.]|nr:helix-turn-helix domain-containing protein [Blastochloris sp.]
MHPPLMLPPLDAATLHEVRQIYDTTTDARIRLRAQIVLLANQQRSVAEIAELVFRSRDTVARVLHRFLEAGIAALQPRTSPGKPLTVTPAWETELLRVIDHDPHTVGVPSANWTTGLLATYLAEATGVQVSAETVRVYLHAHGYVCKRPTWTLKRKAESQEGYVGNA